MEFTVDASGLLTVGRDDRTGRETHGPVGEALEESIEAAPHLGPMDAGAVAALRMLARKIDTEDELRDRALQYAVENQERPPSVDNVSVPTFLKYCESLGLTPAGRGKLPERKTGGARGKLAVLQSGAKAARPAAG